MLLLALFVYIFFDFVSGANQNYATKHRSIELCDSQLNYIETNLDELWARKLRDTWGKMPSGMYSGNYFDFGSFDQCIQFKHLSNSVGEIRGQHCTIMFPYKLEGNDLRPKFAPRPYVSEVSIGIGICIPHTCPIDYVPEIGNNKLLLSMNLSVSTEYVPELFCQVDRSGSFEFNALQIIAIIIFSTVTLLVVLSSFYEISCNVRNSLKHPLLCSFSAYSNSKIILTMKSLSPKEMVFIHGIRALAIIWVVSCHTYMTFWMLPALNGLDFANWIQQASAMFILSGYMGVDTFFLLSAMLLTLSIFHELDRTNRINIPILYMKRYLRITIPLAAGVLFTLTFFYHLSDGPLWHMILTLTTMNHCKSWWWTTLLYVGNYVNPGQLCFGHSWYLFIDMQLYFLSPLILYPLWRYRKYPKVMITILFLIASVAVIYVFTMYILWGFRISMISELAAVKEALLYYLTHARLDSWMMGILMGYILHKIEGKSVTLSKNAVIAGWTLTILTIIVIIFAQYPLHQLNYEDNSLYADASYDAFKRITWCLAVGWIIIACHLSYGGIVKRFLSLSLWLPISKLSYCIYLIHLPVQVIYLSSLRTPQYFTDYRAIYKFFGDFSITFIIAFVWALSFEYPILRLLKIFLDRKKMKGANGLQN